MSTSKTTAEESEYEKALNIFCEENTDDFIPAPIAGGLRYSFGCGWRARDAEVEALEAKLAEVRAWSIQWGQDTRRAMARDVLITILDAQADHE